MGLRMNIAEMGRFFDLAGILFFTAILMVLQGSFVLAAAGSLGLTQESYVGETGGQDVQNIQTVTGRYTGENNAQPWHLGVNIGGGTSVNGAAGSWFFVSEAWAKWASNSSLNSQTSDRPLPADIAVGRKRHAWSKLDDEWNLGLWNPLFRRDPLRPEKQGLTGLFAAWKFGGVRMMIFGSGLSLPEQGPRFQIEDGQFVSLNPWFVEPTDKLILFSHETRVRYRIEMPDIEDIVLQPSGGLLMSVGDRDDGLWMSTGYINKPRNILALPFDASLQLSSTPSSEAVVVIYPHVQRHQLVSIDAGYATQKIDFFMSTLAEFPDSQPPSDQTLTYQLMEPQYLFAPGIEGRPFPSSSLDPRILISWLHQEGGNVREFGPYSSNRISVFAPRMPFTEGLLSTLKVTLVRGYHQSLEASVRWLEEIQQRGTLLMTELRYRPTRAWAVTAGVDVLGTRAVEADKSGLINRFRGNDRVYAGVSYVF